MTVMDRDWLVERLELTDVICYAMRDWDDYMIECQETEMPPTDGFEDFIADEILSAGYHKQEWILVKDRLPEEDKDVLVFGYYHEAFQTLICHYRTDFKGQWFTSVAGQQVYEVTHWMPLPQPPEIKEEKKWISHY